MHRRKLATALQKHFDGDARACRVVARQAGDLSDAGTYREDVCAALTPELVIEELEDAPEDGDVVERWNWWIGSLELAYGGYERYVVRADVVE